MNVQIPAPLIRIVFWQLNPKTQFQIAIAFKILISIPFATLGAIQTQSFTYAAEWNSN